MNDNKTDMTKPELFTLSFNVIMVQDPKLKGFTAYFKQFPNVIAEGKDEKDVMTNLFNALHDVMDFKSKTQTEVFNNCMPVNVIEKSINFKSEAVR